MAETFNKHRSFQLMMEKKETLTAESSETSHSNGGLQARLGASCGEASACRQIVLGLGSAVQAALLAPAEEARSLAVGNTIIGSLGVALGAGAANANCGSQATVELVVVDLQCHQVGCLVAAVIGLVTEVIGIHTLNRRSLVRRAGCAACDGDQRSESNLHLVDVNCATSAVSAVGLE